MASKRMLVVAVVVLLIPMACGRKEGTPPPAAAAAPEAVKPLDINPTSPEIEAMALAKACEADADKAKVEYNGKPFVVKNLLVFMTDAGKGGVDANAYDPASGTVSTSSAGQLKNDPLVSGLEFGFTITFADPKDVGGLRGAHSVMAGEKPTIVYAQRIAVEGTLGYEIPGNTLAISKARLVKVE